MLSGFILLSNQWMEKVRVIFSTHSPLPLLLNSLETLGQPMSAISPSWIELLSAELSTALSSSFAPTTAMPPDQAVDAAQAFLRACASPAPVPHLVCLRTMQAISLLSPSSASSVSAAALAVAAQCASHALLHQDCAGFARHFSRCCAATRCACIAAESDATGAASRAIDALLLTPEALWNPSVCLNAAARLIYVPAKPASVEGQPLVRHAPPDCVPRIVELLLAAIELLCMLHARLASAQAHLKDVMITHSGALLVLLDALFEAAEGLTLGGESLAIFDDPQLPGHLMVISSICRDKSLPEIVWTSAMLLTCQVSFVSLTCRCLGYQNKKRMHVLLLRHKFSGLGLPCSASIVAGRL
jgi:hypothetical protein